MADYTYSGSGTIKLKGCAIAYEALQINIPFGEGSIVYNCSQARRGVIEKVGIKRVKVIANARTYGQPLVQYFDANNRIWFEEDLCTQENALSLAETYLTIQLARINALPCPPT